MINISDKLEAKVVRGPRSREILEQFHNCSSLLEDFLSMFNPIFGFAIKLLRIILSRNPTVENRLIRLWGYYENWRQPKW